MTLRDAITPQCPQRQGGASHTSPSPAPHPPHPNPIQHNCQLLGRHLALIEDKNCGITGYHTVSSGISGPRVRVVECHAAFTRVRPGPWSVVCGALRLSNAWFVSTTYVSSALTQL
ncbi:hypothetical protein E2C01_095283 [Portunus trituberculatus]|uniref:Uncharacterized protein n=1 Tax=Portunus trituberculatus TaxID=210409 RepID=A0A5B7JUV4_PORTR|nr:hypothetical protein [Portunus trituberculatus]